MYRTGSDIATAGAPVAHDPAFRMPPFEAHLSRYVNGACFDRRDLLAGLVAPAIPFRRHARRMIAAYQAFRKAVPEVGPPEIDVRVGTYEGTNAHVRRMSDFLIRYLADDLVGAYVHGSLGTCEETAYSDFDALVIIKDDVFEEPRRLLRVARRLYAARAIMLDYDPLQHHGWFALAEAQLAAYPDHYFPPDLFRYAGALLPSGRTLQIRTVTRPEQYRAAFDDLSSSVVARLERRDYPRNLYELKFLLSQFMLLPALYVQARDGQGIFKRLSFEMARDDFAEQEWAIMDDVSALRARWCPSGNASQRWLLRRPSPAVHRLAKRWAPAFPDSVASVLTDRFYDRMRHLADVMQDRIERGYRS